MPTISNEKLLEFGDVDLNLFWFIKDLGWALCIPHVYIPGAGVAILLAATLVVGHMRWGTKPAHTVHTIADLVWIVANVSWMMGEALYDDNPPALPWHFSPLVRPDKSNYDTAVMGCIILLFIGVLGLIGFYGTLIMQRCCGNPDPNEAVVFGFIPSDVYSRCFILPWMLKDLFWCKNMFIPSLTFGLLACSMLVDALRRSWAGFDRIGALLICEIVWNIGNILWMVDEVALTDKVVMLRYVAAALFIVALLVSLPHTLFAAKVRGDDLSEKPSEATPLTSGKGATGGGGVFVADTPAGSSGP